MSSESATAKAASGADSAPTAALTPAGTLVRTLGLISLLCGLIIVAAYQFTLPAAQANRRLATERAVFKVFPRAKTIAAYDAPTPGGIKAASQSAAEPTPDAQRFYAAYDAQGQLEGIAAEGAAKGYADQVRILFGYRPACQCITGIGVISLRETPGIGDKILTDRDFLENFKALDVRLRPDGAALAHPVTVVKHGAKTQAWQIDAIAGATVTSRAVGKGIQDAAARLLPRLLPHLDTLQKPAQP